MKNSTLIAFFVSTCFRLRALLRQLQHGEISAELLSKNLMFAVKVLETVYIDETK